MKRGAVLLFAAVLFSVPPLGAQSRLWQSDDRVTITSFNHILALAYDGLRLYAATPNGLLIYDSVARRWLPPSTAEDGYPAHEQRVSLVYDRAQGGLWLTGSSGMVYFWSMLSGRWDMRSPFDAPRGAPAPPADAALDIMRGTVGIDASGRRWPVSAIAAAERPGTYWVGTQGGGILHADARSLSSEWLPFGALSTGVSAVAVDARGRLWFGSDGRGPRNGISAGDADGQQWQHYDALHTRAPRRRVTRLLAGDTVWASATDGVYVLPPGARAWREITERDGLASENVRAIARTSAGVWAATERGLALIDAATLAVTWHGMAGVPVYDLAVRADTVWIASERGLWQGWVDGANVQLRVVPGAETDPRLRGRIRSVAHAGGIIAAVTDAELQLWNGAEWQRHPGAGAYAVRGGETLLILRRDMLEEWNPRTNATAMINVLQDVAAGPIVDAARHGDVLWLATPRGAVGLRMRL